jgi:hypothetical protein
MRLCWIRLGITVINGTESRVSFRAYIGRETLISNVGGPCDQGGGMTRLRSTAFGRVLSFTSPTRWWSTVCRAGAMTHKDGFRPLLRRVADCVIAKQPKTVGWADFGCRFRADNAPPVSPLPSNAKFDPSKTHNDMRNRTVTTTTQVPFLFPRHHQSRSMRRGFSRVGRRAVR